MSDCCNHPGQAAIYPARHRCPVNGNEYGAVPETTIKHHITAPWRRQFRQQGYYFCDDPACNVVYFGQDDSVIEQSALRTRVGIKDRNDDATVCYCFGIDRHDAITDPAARIYVVEQTRERACSCGTRNPSGRCCLVDFPQA